MCRKRYRLPFVHCAVLGREVPEHSGLWLDANRKQFISLAGAFHLVMCGKQCPLLPLTDTVRKEIVRASLEMYDPCSYSMYASQPEWFDALDFNELETLQQSIHRVIAQVQAIVAGSDPGHAFQCRLLQVLRGGPYILEKAFLENSARLLFEDVYLQDVEECLKAAGQPKGNQEHSKTFAFMLRYVQHDFARVCPDFTLFSCLCEDMTWEDIISRGKGIDVRMCA